MKNRNISIMPSSFRDPSGFVFIYRNQVYRQINKIFKHHYEHLMSSGLYAELTEKGLLIEHKEVKSIKSFKDECYKVIQPEKIEFISYPYEWCFTQFKDAALLTLKIQKIALKYGMILKDASAYNVQFRDGKPIWIDTLSFEKYKEGSPWIAYRQFCQHFFAPLVLMYYTDVRLSQLLKIYIDGVPLDLATRLLPYHSWLRLAVLFHIHLHSRGEKYLATKEIKKAYIKKISYNEIMGIIENLESYIKRLNWRIRKSVWSDYYKETNYTSIALEHKKNIVSNFLKKTKPHIVWDLGANIGIFSRIASNMGIKTIAFDMDPVAVERNYIECKKIAETNILPLLLDLTNPSPAIGWENRERLSLIQRAPADTVMALALIHHLAISNNLPFDKIAQFFSRICEYLIIEFVPKNDSQVKCLLSAREDIFKNYRKEVFEQVFKKYFRIKESIKIKESERIIYLMKNRK